MVPPLWVLIVANDADTCAINLRYFPKELRKDLHRISVELDEDIQDLVPRYVREGIAKDREVLKKKARGL